MDTSFSQDQRIAAYRLFSYLFSYPTPEVLDEVRELSEQASLSHLESLKALGSVDLDKLQTDYTSLFVNSYPTLLCPPYESFYREGSVYGKAADEVVAIYQQHGLSYEYEGEPPDHISVELDFLAETGDHDFLVRMQQWVPQFASRVKQSETLYTVFARELEELLK